jgi:hypothetical protein
MQKNLPVNSRIRNHRGIYYVASKTAKYYTFWGTIIAAVITGAIGLYIHIDEKNENIQEVIKKEKTHEQPKDTAHLTISNVYLPPINTSLESSFFVEIENNSLNVAKDINVKINFGEASISMCETLPNNVFNGNEKFETSIISFSAGDIEKDDQFYVYCLISQPIFKSILVTGPNLFRNTEYKYKERINVSTSDSNGFLTFFKVISTIVALIFIGYFTIVIISILNKKLETWLK